MMGLVQGSRVPTVVVAVDRPVVIGHPKVSDDLCACGISCDNLRGSMKGAFCLIEVDSVDYVGGDCGGLVTRLADGVYLDGEGYWNFHLAQLAGEFDSLGGTPTVPVDDDGSLLSLGGREDAILIGIDEVHDVVKGLSAVVVSEYFYMDGGVTVAKICGELDFGMLCVFDTDKASDKPDDDYVSISGGSRGGGDFPGGQLLPMHGAGRY